MGHIAYPSGTWRCKMTVEVETLEDVKTGSAMREVSVKMVPKLSSHMLPTVKLKGNPFGDQADMSFDFYNEVALQAYNQKLVSSSNPYLGHLRKPLFLSF